MATVKNEHVVYAYMPLVTGGTLLLVGITDIGWEYLKEEYGNFLKSPYPPSGLDATQSIWIVRGVNKEDIKRMIARIAEQQGAPIISYRDEIH